MNDMLSFKVFVSHGAGDSWVARQMGRRIREDCEAGTFLDVDDVASGDNFKERIHAELHQAQELVVLFTPWSVTRSWVWIEVGVTWGQGKRVIAVLHGLSITQFEELAGGKAILEHINILELNDFDRYLTELRSRVSEANNG